MDEGRWNWLALSPRQPAGADAQPSYDDAELYDYYGLPKEEADRINAEVDQNITLEAFLFSDSKRRRKPANNNEEKTDSIGMKLGEIIAGMKSYIERNPDTKVAHLLADITPRLIEAAKENTATSAAVELPGSAPALWTTDRKPEDTPATFIMREYSKYVGKGLTPGLINKLDPTLGARLREWRKLEEKTIPPGFDLSTRSEVVSKRDSAISKEQAQEGRKLAAREYRHRKRSEHAVR